MGRRHHRWIALIALIGLLFQQVVMASYLCPVEQSGRALFAMQEILDQPPCHADTALIEAIDSDLARCHQHCQPTVSSTDTMQSLAAPAALTLPAFWTDPALIRLVVTASPPDPSVDPHAGAPPLSVRFCSFQI